MKTFSLLLSILLLSFAINSPAADAPKEQPKADATTGNTAQDLWARIDAQRKLLGDAVAANKKDDVSRMGDDLKAFAKALESKYPEVNATKRQSIHHEGKTIGRLCDDLTDAVAAGQADQANQILGRIDSTIKFLKDTTAKK